MYLGVNSQMYVFAVTPDDVSREMSSKFANGESDSAILHSLQSFDS